LIAQQTDKQPEAWWRSNRRRRQQVDHDLWPVPERERADRQRYSAGNDSALTGSLRKVERMEDEEFITGLRKSEEDHRFNVRLSCQHLADIAGKYAAKAENLSRESAEGEGYSGTFHEFAEIRKLLSQAENSFNKTVRQHEAALISLKEALGR
jgi:hypothetical protein